MSYHNTTSLCAFRRQSGCRWIAALLVGQCLLLTPSASSAAPTIYGDLTAVENRPEPDYVFNIPGLHLLTRVDASSDVTGATVRSDNNQFPFANPPKSAADLDQISGTSSWIKLSPLQAPDFSVPADFAKITGEYTYRVTDGHSADSLGSHQLDIPAVVPHPISLTVSDYSTTPWFSFTDPNPTTADPNELTRVYDVVIFSSTGLQVAILDSVTEASGHPSFHIPAFKLTAGQQYWFRAQSIDIDLEGQHQDPFVENIGEALLSFTPAAVPESTHIAALGGALIAMAGFRPRRKGR